MAGGPISACCHQCIDSSWVIIIVVEQYCFTWFSSQAQGVKLSSSKTIFEATGRMQAAPSSSSVARKTSPVAIRTSSWSRQVEALDH